MRVRVCAHLMRGRQNRRRSSTVRWLQILVSCLSCEESCGRKGRLASLSGRGEGMERDAGGRWLFTCVCNIEKRSENWTICISSGCYKTGAVLRRLILTPAARSRAEYTAQLELVRKWWRKRACNFEFRRGWGGKEMEEEKWRTNFFDNDCHRMRKEIKNINNSDKETSDKSSCSDFVFRNTRKKLQSILL